MDPEQKKKALKSINYGVYVLTSHSGDEFAGATVTWVSQASLNPPQIMVGLRKGSKTELMVSKEKTFALNILGESQKYIAKTFLKHATVAGDEINGYSFRTEKTGAPILAAAVAFIECQIAHTVSGTDHDVVIANVINAGYQSEESPLVLKTTGWSYGG
jgi:flavin reductase (DIM6/NTAB) family NADH-FMN oxidoreductase RutF